MHVYAPTLADAGLSLSATSRGPHVTVARWSSAADGSGTVLNASSTLSTNTEFFAQWAASGITSISASYDDSPLPARSGTTYLSATDATPGGGNENITDLMDFSSSNPDDSAGSSDGSGWLNVGVVGPRTITAMLRSNHAVKATFVVNVVHSDQINTINLTLSPTTVITGKTSTAYLGAEDGSGNSFGKNLIGSNNCDGCEITITSSDPSDVIDSATGVITFTTLGRHTISAKVDLGEGGTYDASTIVDVISVPIAPPAPAGPQLKTLAFTGVQVTPAPWIAGLLILLGLSCVLVARRRRHKTAE